jgi:hypothetical protein
MDETPLVCSRCSAELRPGRGELYVVRIEAFADPSPPDLTSEDLMRDLRGEIDRLIRSLDRLSPQEAMDQVYRRLTIFLCNACYRAWIESPAG